MVKILCAALKRSSIEGKFLEGKFFTEFILCAPTFILQEVTVKYSHFRYSFSQESSKFPTQGRDRSKYPWLDALYLFKRWKSSSKTLLIYFMSKLEFKSNLVEFFHKYQLLFVITTTTNWSNIWPCCGTRRMYVALNCSRLIYGSNKWSVTKIFFLYFSHLLIWDRPFL